MKKHQLFRLCCCIIYLICFFVQPFSTAFAAKKPTVLSPAAIVMDAENGNILFKKDAYSAYYPASCTKILTAILTIEACENPETDISLKSEVTMSKNAVWGFDRNSSHIALDEGETVTVEDLLHGLLLASANECALALAEVVSGSVDNFVSLMNTKAKEIGVGESCNFVNPHGLFEYSHTASAYDLAVLMQYCVQNETFVKISSKTIYSIPPTNKSSEPHTFCNCYKMLSNGSYYYPDMICGKTGWTSKSLGSLVNYAHHDDTNTSLIVVTTGSKTNADGYSDVASLLDYYFENYRSEGKTSTAATNALPLGIFSSRAVAANVLIDDSSNDAGVMPGYILYPVLFLAVFCLLITLGKKRARKRRRLRRRRTLNRKIRRRI